MYIRGVFLIKNEGPPKPWVSILKCYSDLDGKTGYPYFRKTPCIHM